MSNKNGAIQAIRGFKDILPIATKETRPSSEWRDLETKLTQVLDSYGYSQIRLPLVEETQLFARGVGEATDIVEKEMFSVSYCSDKNGGEKGDKTNESASFSLRPEGTAGAVRAIIEHNLTRGDTPKLWYMGAMFRYERPQKGRYRQFHQLGVESFGSELPDADAELIAMTATMWQKLGIADHVTLQLNSLGESSERQAYKNALVEYLNAHFNKLDEDSQRRVTTNPLRVLDSKIESTQAILQNAPRLADFLGEDSNAHFEQVKAYLTALNISFEINDKLVRGLDYYNKTVFEWVTDKLGSQATICGGGRYDGLVGLLKGKPEQSEPAVGFAMGLERLLLLIEEVNPQERTADCDVFVVASPEFFAQGMQYAHALRENRDDLRVKMASATSLKAQMKKADKSGAKFTVIIGEDEVKNNQVTIKNMATGEQNTIDNDDFWFDKWAMVAENFHEFVLPWIESFGETDMPQTLSDLLSFIYMNGLHDEGDFSQGFYVNTDDKIYRHGLQVGWSDNEEFLTQLYPFATANGSGSFYAIWHYDNTLSLDEMPIVAFGDEGGGHIVAENLPKLFQLLTYDADPSIAHESVFYLRDDDIDEEYYESDYHTEFVEWVKDNYGLPAVENSEQADEIIAEAQEKFGKQFKTWLSQFIDNE